MKIYVISDTHFNHKAIKDFCGRPDHHEKLMFDNMKRLGKESCLIHLGDVCLSKDKVAHDKYIQPLKCRKILLLGNHDTKTWSWYMNNGWDFVCDTFKLNYAGKVILFSHVPQAWDGLWDLNVHGHLHNLGHRKYAKDICKGFMRLYAPEIMNYKPVEVKKLIG